jgi:hypothetical protein
MKRTTMIVNPGMNLESRNGSRLFGLVSALILTVILLTRAWFEFVHIDQPIYEGYVGRQVPTAMVARNLTRESPFLYPTLQSGPFPSWFLIEAPIYAQTVAWLADFTDFPIERCGRLISLSGLVLGLLATGDLVRRRYGNKAAMWAMIFFVTWPVTVRYARAFQPDMFAIGLFLLGVDFRRRADDSVGADDENDIYPTIAWFALAVALASKVTLAPLMFGLAYPRIAAKPAHSNIRFLASTLIPAIAWYGWAAWLTFAGGEKSGGHSLDGFSFWLNAPGPFSLLSISNLKAIGMNLVAKAWTPVGFLLFAVIPMIWKRDPAMRRWTLALGCWFLAVGGKAHHSYYLLVPTPLLAVLGGWFMARIDGNHGHSNLLFRITVRHLGIAAAGLMVAFSLVISLDTYETPPEWKPLEADLSQLQSWVGDSTDKPFIGHEAAIFAVDRPGFRWEWSPAAQKRAAAAFGERLEGDSPGALLDFYVRKGAGYLLILESDPEFAIRGKELEPILAKMRIVLRSEGLVLYKLTDIATP